MTKKIVHLSTVHSWQDPRIFLKQCKSLAANGFEVHLITKDGSGEDIEGVKIHKLKKTYSNKLLRMILGARAAWRQALALKPDLIHFHDPELIPGALRLKSKTDIPIIYDVHEDYTTSIEVRKYIPGFLLSLIKKRVQFYEGQAHEELDIVIAEDYYEERFPNSTKIRNYPILWKKGELNGINKRERPNKLLYTGTIDYSRGAENHALLHNSLEGLEVRMIGRCSADVYKFLESILGDEVKRVVPYGICDYVPQTEIIKAYEEGEYLAGLALFDKTSHFARKRLTKFYEYMYFGLPIVCSDYSEWENFIASTNSGFTVNPKSIIDIKKLVEALSVGNSRINTEETKKIVEKRFNWEIEAENLYNLYLRILGL